MNSLFLSIRHQTSHKTFSQRLQMWALAAFSFALLSLSTQQAHANTAFQAQQFRPWSDPDGMFQTQSGHTLKHLGYLVGLYFNYAKDPLTLRDKDGKIMQSILSHQLGLDLNAGIGLFGFLEADLVIPMTLYQSAKIPDLAGFEPDRNKDLSGFAFSDIKLQMKGQLLRQKRHWLNLGLRLFLGFPSGATDRFNGEDGVTFGVGLMLDRKFGKRVRVALNFGYRYLPPTSFVDLIIQHELTYSLGISVNVVERYLDLLADFSGATALSEKTSLSSAPLEFYAGTRIYPLGRRDLAINIGLGSGLFYPGYGAPQFRAFVGVMWSPRDVDTDKDGILDRLDKCPKTPGPKENNGCPWGDKDNDGLTDNVDKCPDKPGPKANNGCPWGDKDGDGLTDNVDKCPDKPGPKANHGCPWGDKDNDGLKDNVDKCPNKPGPKANNGCPWGDRDKDGLTDNIDRCPDKPGPKQYKGCPDSDKDKVPDPDDRCPFVRGVPERKGCPKVVLVKVTKKEIKILQKIYFATASARIRLRSYGVLKQVVQVLKSRPKLRILIEGHTDNRGGKRYNLRLSQRRAESVRRFLIKQGISPDRLEAKGYGMSRPLVPNNSRKNRAKNRRVQFKIISGELNK